MKPLDTCNYKKHFETILLNLPLRSNGHSDGYLPSQKVTTNVNHFQQIQYEQNLLKKKC